MSLLLLLSLPLPSSTQVQPCFLRCKDNFLNGLHEQMSDSSSEWSLELLTPLETLLNGQRSKGRLSKRIKIICRYNMEYEHCLTRCPFAPATEILTKGQHAWNEICNAHDNDPDFRSSVVPCWDEYGREISKKCREEGKALQAEMLVIIQGGTEHVADGIDGLCESLHSYEHCFAERNAQFCGDTAELFLAKLSYRTTGTLLEMLSAIIKNKTLPPSCQQTLSLTHKEWDEITDLHHNSLRKLRNRASPLQNMFVLISSILFMHFVLI